MSPLMLSGVPAWILVPKPSVRLGHRKYTVPAPNPATAAPSPASQAVRRNDRRLTCGFFGAGRGLAGPTPEEIDIDSLPRFPYNSKNRQVLSGWTGVEQFWLHGQTHSKLGPRKNEPDSTRMDQKIRNIGNIRMAALRFSGRINGFLSK